MVSFPKQLGQAGTRMIRTGQDLNEARYDGGFGKAVASVGPYADNLHLVPDR